MRKKHATQDFDVSMLPKNRFGLFFDVCKNRLSLILGAGLLLLLFCAPIAVVSAIINLKTFDVNAQVSAGIVTAEDGAKEIFRLTNGGNLVLVPCFAVLALGLCGIAGVFRRLVFQDGIFFWADFGKSLKENWGTFCGVAVVLGGINYLTQYCLRAAYFDNGTGMQVALGACIVAFALSALIAPMILVQCTLYNLPFVKKAANAFLLSMRMPHFALAMLLTNVAPFLLLLIPNKYVYVVCLVLLPLLVVPVQVLVNLLVCDSILDRFVNKEHFPEIYRKGMYNAENRDSTSE